MKSQSKVNLAGVHIQWPWSRLLLSGEKTVETRGYPLPKKYWGAPIAIIETAGKNGKKRAGIQSAHIIGIVTFARSFQYPSEKEWAADKKRHLVGQDDPNFGFSATKKKFAWEVQSIQPISPPKKAPKVRGIVFANNCRV